MSSRTGICLTVPSLATFSISSHWGKLRPSSASRAALIRVTFLERSRNPIFQPGLTRIDGVLTFLPFTMK